MKSLDAASTSPKEAIVIAITELWLELYFQWDEIEKIAEKVGTHMFTNFSDHIVGRVILDNSDIPDRFNKYVAGNPDLAAIYKKAGRIYTSGDSFETRVSPNFGRHLKTSAWWTRNLKEIEKHKKNLKAEVDAFLTHAVMAAGFKSIAEGKNKPPMLTLPEKEEK